jgi:hypothetical protein
VVRLRNAWALGVERACARALRPLSRPAKSNPRRATSCLGVAQRRRVADGDTDEGADSAGEARRYPAGVSSGATTICTRDVVLSRISFTGW